MTTAGSMVRIFIALCLVCSVAGSADGGSTVGDMPGQRPGTIGESIGTPGPAPPPDRPDDDLCDTTPGDVNLDGSVNVGDTVVLLNFLRCEAVLDDQQIANSDVNSECLVNLYDVYYLMDYVFYSGPAPLPCVCAEPAVTACRCESTGDVNLDDSVNIGDAVALNYFLNCHATPTDEQLIQSDVNGDCVVDLDDSQYIVDLVFSGGPDPVPCMCAEKEGPDCE